MSVSRRKTMAARTAITGVAVGIAGAQAACAGDHEAPALITPHEPDVVDLAPPAEDAGAPPPRVVEDDLDAFCASRRSAGRSGKVFGPRVLQDAGPIADAGALAAGRRVPCVVLVAQGEPVDPRVDDPSCTVVAVPPGSDELGDEWRDLAERARDRCP
jgi:hypothetical protein